MPLKNEEIEKPKKKIKKRKYRRDPNRLIPDFKAYKAYDAKKTKEQRHIEYRRCTSGFVDFN